jgi:hypothetical protein
MLSSEGKIGLEVILCDDAYEYVTSVYNEEAAKKQYIIVFGSGTDTIYTINLLDGDDTGSNYCRFSRTDLKVTKQLMCKKRKLRIVNSIRKKMGCANFDFKAPNIWRD